MIDWPAISSVFLDMDGTLLDLHFDNYFWRHYVPEKYAKHRGLDFDTAKQQLFERYKAVEGTMDWYCLDYWTRELGIDIPALKEEVDHLITVHPYVIDFLDAVRQAGKRIALVTNAHGKSLALKMRHTQLGGHFHALICAHDLGLPKEDPDFWQQLQAVEPFAPAHTLLVDDSLPVLRAARAYGIGYLLAVYRPDSRSPKQDVGEFQAIHSFREILPIH